MICRSTLFLLFLSLLGCKKESQTIPSTPYTARPQAYTGIATAYKDGKYWQASVFAFRTEALGGTGARFAFYLDNYVKVDGDTFRKDVLLFGSLKLDQYSPYLKSGYKLGGGIDSSALSEESVYFDVYDVDIWEDHPYLLESQRNFFSINSYDEKNQKFAGSFSLEFISQNLKDTIRFTDGNFAGVIYKSAYP